MRCGVGLRVGIAAHGRTSFVLGVLLFIFKIQVMQLSKGRVTQNGNWISYKTEVSGESINFYQELAAELRAFLTKKGIGTDGDFHVAHAVNSTSRKGCVTVKVFSSDSSMNVFPFESHSVD